MWDIGETRAISHRSNNAWRGKENTNVQKVPMQTLGITADQLSAVAAFRSQYIEHLAGYTWSKITAALGKEVWSPRTDKNLAGMYLTAIADAGLISQPLELAQKPTSRKKYNHVNMYWVGTEGLWWGLCEKRSYLPVFICSILPRYRGRASCAAVKKNRKGIGAVRVED
jgi:hypothetical protein